MTIKENNTFVYKFQISSQFLHKIKNKNQLPFSKRQSKSSDCYFMGGMFQKQIKNYVLPVLAQSKKEEPVRVKPEIPFYAINLIKEVYEIPCYSLKSRKNVKLEFVRSQIYQKPVNLTLLTYNVWFQSHNTENRYPCILTMLADSGADFICLQEVNQQFLQLLHSPSGRYKKLGEYYLPNMKMHWYDTLILSKYPCRFYRKIFETSGMGRNSLTAVVEFAEGKDRSWTVGVNCVHLESMNFPKERINQLEMIGKANEKMDMSIIAGDFNFSDGWEENKVIEGYVDVWKQGKRHFSQWAGEQQREKGFTMPTNTKFPAWRPDHVIYRSKVKKEVKNDQIEIIGDFSVTPYEQQRVELVADDNQVRSPSDHFGLIAKIAL